MVDTPVPVQLLHTHAHLSNTMGTLKTLRNSCTVLYNINLDWEYSERIGEGVSVEVLESDENWSQHSEAVAEVNALLARWQALKVCTFFLLFYCFRLKFFSRFYF